MSNIPSLRKRAKRVSYAEQDSDLESEFNDRDKKLKKRKRNYHNDATDVYYPDDQTNVGTSSVRHPASLHRLPNSMPLRSALLSWYSEVHEKRGMPWRKNYDPSLDATERSQRAYEVWISEVMLQQTQVATVIPYYNKWMETFPTISDLACSDIETVNGLWKGLGYYSRAARLLAGAQKIMREYDGLFPNSAQDMMANIPGIGRYSAGAISSIAYNQCEPVLDGNVTRLLSRILALHANPKAKATLDILWDAATVMVNKSDRPGDINQALIELGATVCKVREPICGTCPLNAHCGAYLESQNQLPAEQEIEELCTLCEPVHLTEDEGVMRYPMKVERKKSREEIDVVNVIEWASPKNVRYFILARRPEKGLLAGLHEFPSRVDVKQGDTSSVLKKIGLEVLDELLVTSPSKIDTGTGRTGELRISKIRPAGEVLHIFSHIKKTYRIQWILLEGGEQPPSVKTHYLPSPIPKTKTNVTQAASKLEKRNPALRWVSFDEVEQANIGTGVMKIWEKVNKFWQEK